MLSIMHLSDSNACIKDPKFVHREKILKLHDELFSRWYTDDKDLRELIIASLLVRDSKVLLIGPPEAGKTTLVRLIANSIYADSDDEVIYSKIIGAPEKTLQKVLVTTNIIRLITEGKEEFIVRPIVRARIKFINEINRFSKAVQDALLSLLEEKEIEYGGIKFRTPSFIAFADMNPYRGDIDRALKTRFMVSAYIPFVPMTGSIKIIDQMFMQKEEIRDLAETMSQILSIKELESIWQDVSKVHVPLRMSLFANLLIWAFRVCKYDKSKIMPGFMRLACAQCEYANEICSQIAIPPGERAIISALLFSKARAWFHGRKEIGYEDIIWATPWVVAHRIELVTSIKAEIPNPWEWSKNVVRELIRSKWYYVENGEETFGFWVRGLALATLSLNAELDYLLLKVLEEYYPELLTDSRDARFKAVKELRKLAYDEEGRGDLVLQQLYNVVRENFSEYSAKLAKQLEPKVMEIISRDNVTLDEIMDLMNKLSQPLPEDVNHLSELLLTKLEELTIRVSLMMPGIIEKVRDILLTYNFNPNEIVEFLSGHRKALENRFLSAKLAGGFLTIRAWNTEIARDIREKIEGG